MAAIPAYNEESNIVSVVERTRPHVDIVVVIDDGSLDDTARLAEAAGAVVVRHRTNLGKAGGIMTAANFATVRDIDYLVLLDGDGQHDPADIPRLLDPLRRGLADIVVGSRFLEIRNPIPFYRTIGQRVLNVATHAGSGLRCSDSQCGYRALTRDVFSRLSLHETFLHGLAVESEMQFQVSELGFRMHEVPIFVSYDERARRSPIKHGFGVLFRVIAMSSRKWSGKTSRRTEPRSSATQFDVSSRAAK